MLKKTVAALMTATQTNTSGRVRKPCQYAKGMMAIATNRIRSQAMSIRRRSHRSASAPATRLSTGMATYWAVLIRPTSKADASKRKTSTVGMMNSVMRSPK